MVVAPMAAHMPDQMLVRNRCLDQWDGKGAEADSHSSIGMAKLADCPEARRFAPVASMMAEHQSPRHPVVGVVAAIVKVVAGYQTDFAALIGCQKWVVRPAVAQVVLPPTRIGIVVWRSRMQN